jgi:hypothetical protein
LNAGLNFDAWVFAPTIKASFFTGAFTIMRTALGNYWRWYCKNDRLEWQNGATRKDSLLLLQAIP